MTPLNSKIKFKDIYPDYIEFKNKMSGTILEPLLNLNPTTSEHLFNFAQRRYYERTFRNDTLRGITATVEQVWTDAYREYIKIDELYEQGNNIWKSLSNEQRAYVLPNVKETDLPSVDKFIRQIAQGDNEKINSHELYDFLINLQGVYKTFIKKLSEIFNPILSSEVGTSEIGTDKVIIKFAEEKLSGDEIYQSDINITNKNDHNIFALTISNLQENVEINKDDIVVIKETISTELQPEIATLKSKTQFFNEVGEITKAPVNDFDPVRKIDLGGGGGRKIIELFSAGTHPINNSPLLLNDNWENYDDIVIIQTEDGAFTDFFGLKENTTSLIVKYYIDLLNEKSLTKSFIKLWSPWQDSNYIEYIFELGNKTLEINQHLGTNYVYRVIGITYE